eukprot:TRINITY_DN554_c0_g1_i7.p1 TRINITY_DN554_c0_g1~~TRINITY_DN554_c0_g1_i7.p1  ORF type:complete len:638 (+),score=287.73 TRINITY_DN554_c0_g1_i7:104-1915(+)
MTVQVSLEAFVRTVLGPLWYLWRGVYLTDGPRTLRGLVYILLATTFLQESTLFDFTSDEELRSVECSEADFKYRMADGTCNHKELTKMGAKGTRFGRNVRSTWETTTPPHNYLWEPRPEAAAKLMTSYGNKREAIPSLNLFFGAWIQFQTHDWFNHEKDAEAAPYVLNTRAAEDGGAAGAQTFPLQRTKRDADGYMRTRTTHWWDMSQVYGSDRATQESLRSFVDGKLLFGDNGLLPKDNATGVAATGFTNNLWSGIEALHTLYAKEHNWICDELKARNPTWDDEKLFQTARLINAAQNAIIHTEEWTAILLQNRPVTMALRIGTRGVATMKKQFKSDFSVWDRVALAIFDLLPFPGADGIGDEVKLEGDSAFSQTEDFVSVYRMHALLPDNMTVGGETDSLLSHTFAAGRDKVEQHGVEEVILGMAKMNTHKLTLHNFPQSLSNLQMPGGSVLDMAAVDIFRDRERGIPKFNDFREGLGLERFKSFEEVNPDPQVVAELRELYATVDDIDTQVGMSAEEPRPSGFAISETTFFVFLTQTTRRLHADRFFQEDFTAETYTQWGLDHVWSAKFKSLFERHYPNTVSAFPTGDFPLKGSAFLFKQ